MNKDNLQQELLEKVKQGIKPSDLKKRKTSLYHSMPEENNTPPASPPISPIIEPIGKSWNSGNNKKAPEPEKDQKFQALERKVNFWSQTAQTHLTNLQRATAELDQAEERIKELEWVLKQKPTPETISQAAEQALMEANQKIRELEAKNKQLKENITQLENQVKNTTETKEIGTQTEPKPKHYLFTCDICEQNKKSQLHLAKVNGLGINPHKQNKICDYCIRKVDLIKEKEEFF